MRFQKPKMVLKMKMACISIDSFACSTEGINNASPRSGIGVYVSQDENVKVHGVALKCGYLVNKYSKSTEWYWSVYMDKN